MSETSNTGLVARLYAESVGIQLTAEFEPEHLGHDRDWETESALLDEAADAIESLTATLTETEADFQASRGREEALQAKITAALVFSDEAGEIDHEESNFAAGARVVAAILESAPSPALEAVKSVTTTEYTTHFCNPFCPSSCEQFGRRLCRQVTDWVPASAEGESRESK